MLFKRSITSELSETMAPKAAVKAKKAPVPIPEPEDKTIPPDLTAVVADFHTTDLETQQQALTRLFAIKEYPGAKVFYEQLAGKI